MAPSPPDVNGVLGISEKLAHRTKKDCKHWAKQHLQSLTDSVFRLTPAVQQGGLGLCPQPIAPEPVAVVGPQQPVLFERGHDRLQIVGAGRETVQLAGWELSRDGGQR